MSCVTAFTTHPRLRLLLLFNIHGQSTLRRHGSIMVRLHGEVGRSRGTAAFTLNDCWAERNYHNSRLTCAVRTRSSTDSESTPIYDIMCKI